MERWAKSGQIHATMELGFELFREKREKGEEEEEERRHKTLVPTQDFSGPCRLHVRRLGSRLRRGRSGAPRDRRAVCRPGLAHAWSATLPALSMPVSPGRLRLG